VATQHTPTASAVSDYERIGGDPAVEVVSDRLCDLVLRDEPLAACFDGMGLAQIERHHQQLVAHALGAPAGAGREDLRQAHACLPLDPDHVDQVACYLAQALHDVGAEPEVIARVGDALATARDEVVASVGDDQ